MPKLARVMLCQPEVGNRDVRKYNKKYKLKYEGRGIMIKYEDTPKSVERDLAIARKEMADPNFHGVSEKEMMKMFDLNVRHTCEFIHRKDRTKI